MRLNPGAVIVDAQTIKKYRPEPGGRQGSLILVYLDNLCVLGCDVTINVLAIGRNSHQNSLDLCVTSRALGRVRDNIRRRKGHKASQLHKQDEQQMGREVQDIFCRELQGVHEKLRQGDKDIPNQVRHAPHGEERHGWARTSA